MPWNEYGLGFEGVGLGNKCLGEDVALVGDLGHHVVDEEGLREVVLIVRVGHGLELDGHGGAGLDVADLVHARGRIAVRVEEFGHGRLVLREFLVAAVVELLVVVDHVVGLGREELTNLLVLEDGVQDQDLVHGWLGALVSDPSQRGQREEGEVDFPDEGLGDHDEAESTVCDQAPSPAVIRSVESRARLPQVVACAHHPLVLYVLEDIVAVFEVGRVAVSLLWLEASGSPKDGLVIIEVVAINASGWLESLVVPAGIESGATAGLAGLGLLGGGTKIPDTGAAKYHALR